MKYKIGDKVRIKSRDWYNEHKDMNGNVCYGCEDIFNPCTARHCGQVLTIKHINSLGWYEVEEEAVFVNDGMIEGLVEDTITLNGKEVLLELANIELPSGTTKIWECPKGYQFTDENGNVINATKIILEKKKKEYPKTYEECIGKLSINWDCKVDGYKHNLLAILQKLLICRDIYWKIAGEEMGLGKPWEPDFRGVTTSYVITVECNKILKSWTTKKQVILAFPTAEMRDVFYENFKNEIEQCKKLL